MGFAWSHTTYALWRGIIFNFEDKWDLDYFLAHSDGIRVSAKFAWDYYELFPRIRISSSRSLGSNSERAARIREWKKHDNK